MGVQSSSLTIIVCVGRESPATFTKDADSPHCRVCPPSPVQTQTEGGGGENREVHVHVHAHVHVYKKIPQTAHCVHGRTLCLEYHGFDSHPRQFIFLRKSDCLGCGVLYDYM